MAEFISSQQALSQTADGKLYDNLIGDQAAADYIGFLVLKATNGDMDAALAARSAVMAGEFSVSTTQVAAQTKSFDDAKKITDIADNPTAMFSFAGVESGIDISSILQSKVYYWANTTGAGKNTQTNYHLREVFDDVGAEPDDYVPNWFDPQPVNRPPTLTVGDASNELREAGETLDHQPVGAVLEATIKLTAADPDVGDVLTYNTSGWYNAGNGTFTKAGEYGTASLDTNSGLVTYTLDPLLDLPAEAEEIDTFTMSVSDGKASSSVVDITFTINGTGDWYNASLTPIVVIKGDSVSDSDSIPFIQQNVELVKVTVTGTGDYDAQNEGFSLTGDAKLDFSGSAPNSEKNSGPEKDVSIVIGPLDATIAIVDTTPQSFDYAVDFTSQTQKDSSVTIAVDYEYWA
ncbi:MAG: Ig-like domain-containing protein [Allorhizobium sp.]